MREWLVSLMREAVRAEVESHFRALEDKAVLVEAALSSVAVRPKDKQEAQKPARPRTWNEAKTRLEAEAVNG